MKGIYWLLFFWFAPIVAIVALWVKVVVAVCVLSMKVIVWGFQQVLKVVGKAIEIGQDKVKEFRIRKNVTQPVSVL